MRTHPFQHQEDGSMPWLKVVAGNTDLAAAIGNGQWREGCSLGGRCRGVQRICCHLEPTGEGPSPTGLESTGFQLKSPAAL